VSQEFWTVVVVLVVFGLVVPAMARGWRNRQRAQEGLYDALPVMPEDPGEVVLGPLTGVYVGSTMAGDWNARIARPPLGHRSAATLTAHTGGLALELADASVWIPRADLESVRRETALANKVVPGDGLLVARWHVSGRDGHTVVDSGFRADDKDTYPHWEALRGDAAPADPETDRSTTEENQ
jgi:hypothetical protein